MEQVNKKMIIMNTQLLDPRSMNPINAREMAATTENRLAGIRKTMKIYKTRDLIRRQGWFWSEPNVR